MRAFDRLINVSVTVLGSGLKGLMGSYDAKYYGSMSGTGASWHLCIILVDLCSDICGRVSCNRAADIVSGIEFCC